jgi:hypothetical protein
MEILVKVRTAWITAITAFASIGIVHAHHGTAFFFDISKVVTLEGEVLRVEWVNPHRRLYIQSINDEGELVTWTLWGSSNFTGPGAAELKERLQPGVLIVARAFPSRNSERRAAASGNPFPNGPFEVGAGEIRFPNGDIEKFGEGPTF